MKKILTIFLILFLSSAFALGVYNFIYLPHQADINRPPETGVKVAKEAAPENKAFAISKEAVIGPAISEDKAHIVFYLKSSGNVIQTDLDGRNQKIISSYIISNITNVEWSPKKDMAACSRIENNQEISYIYNYTAAKKYDLNANAQEIHFSPNNNKIIYNFINSAGENNISIADTDGKSWNAVFNTRISNPKLQWIDNLKIAVFEHPSYKKTSSILIADTTDSHLERILSGNYGLSAKFSPDGKKILYTYSDNEGKKMNLSFFDISSGKELQTKIETFAEKCVWSINNTDIFCSVPQSLPYSNLPDQFYEPNFASSDSIIKIDSATGDKKEILPALDSSEIDARELFLSTTEDRLYFINQHNGKLFGVNL